MAGPRRYHLVPDDISGDTVTALEQLLADARDGKLIGLAFGAMYKRKRCIVNTAGECRHSPIFATGMAVELLLHCREGENESGV